MFDTVNSASCYPNSLGKQRGQSLDQTSVPHVYLVKTSFVANCGTVRHRSPPGQLFPGRPQHQRGSFAGGASGAASKPPPGSVGGTPSGSSGSSSSTPVPPVPPGYFLPRVSRTWALDILLQLHDSSLAGNASVLIKQHALAACVAFEDDCFCGF